MIEKYNDMPFLQNRWSSGIKCEQWNQRFLLRWFCFLSFSQAEKKKDHIYYCFCVINFSLINIIWIEKHAEFLSKMLLSHMFYHQGINQNVIIYECWKNFYSVTSWSYSYTVSKNLYVFNIYWFYVTIDFSERICY